MVTFAFVKVVTAAQCRQLEDYTLTHGQLSRLDLMERAAEAVAREVAELMATRERLVVFAGHGGNGGDALAAARIVYQKLTCPVEVYLIRNERKLSQECQANKERLCRECPDVKMNEVVGQFNMPEIGRGDVVLDGLFGCGLSRPLTGGYAMLARQLNRGEGTIVSIDVPSGLMTEDNSENYRANIVRADVTLCIGALKPAFLMADNQSILGRWKVLDIGLLTDECTLEGPGYQIVEATAVGRLLRKRDLFSNKGTFGHGLLIAGQWGMAGAAVLAARAALKSGIGKVSVYTPQTNNDIMQIAVPEAIVKHAGRDNFMGPALILDAYSALAVGPGMGTQKDASLAMIKYVNGSRIPVVIDADGLNILADHKGWLYQLPANAVLTPHPREFERLFGECHDSFRMLEEARQSAKEYGVYIVLKGHYTAICNPQGDVLFNNTGNPGMATAGTGDALTGVLLSLLAQGYPVGDALQMGVYVHGLAGDIAAEEMGEEGMTASDLIACIPRAFKRLHELGAE